MLRELKQLQKENKETKVNTLARRDNERAIRILKQRIKESEHRYAYYSNRQVENSPQSLKNSHVIHCGN
jgi:hypothetical protein